MSRQKKAQAQEDRERQVQRLLKEAVRLLAGGDGEDSE